MCASRYGLPPSSPGDAEPFEPAQHDVEPAVVERLGVRDDSGAPDRENRRPPLVVGFVSGLQQHHPDDPVAAERIADHRAIPRLENVQRQEHVREENDVREREERNGGEA